MKLKEAVESNPLIYLLGTAVTVGIFVGGIQEYFCRERIEIANQRSTLEIGTLQSELASIKRGLGESKYLDVRNFVYPKGRSPLSPINPKAKYVAGDEFFAILDLPGWDYEEMNIEELNRKVYNGELPPLWKKMVGGYRLHVWTAKVPKPTKVTDADHYRVPGPFVTFEKMPISAITGFAKNLPDWEKEIGRTMTPQETREVKDVLTDLENMFRGDAAQLALIGLIEPRYDGLTSAGGGISTEIVQLQKVGNVLYAQFLTTLRNVQVDDKDASVFFVREEIMFISDHENMIEIHTFVPSSDPTPRGAVYTRIQEWFSGLAIPVG